MIDRTEERRTMEIKRCTDALRHIEWYRQKKENTVFDDFWTGDLDLFEALIHKKLLELKGSKDETL